MKPTKKILILCALSSALSACAGFFDTDNAPKPTPLTNYTPEAHVRSVWSTSTGFGVGADYLKLLPAVTDRAVFTANKNGFVVATDKATGSNLWQKNTKKPISAGPTAHDGLVFVGTRDGDVIALNQTDGKLAWESKASTEILAPIAANNDIAIVKTLDGKISALSEHDGHMIWEYQETEPTTILRGASAPQITRDSVIVAFANGNLAKFSFHNGTLLWKNTIATPDGFFAIQRMVDIDADPVVFKNRVYAAAYQGKIAAFDLSSGKEFWTHDISSYSGLIADDKQVYISDAKGDITAFNAESGAPAWRQTNLEARNLTGPVIMDNYLVVGDEQGYLHWLSKQDGHFIARTRVGGEGVLSTPVVENGVLYVMTRNGRLTAYTLS